jgi:lysophospholipase L1-like esterase
MTIPAAAGSHERLFVLPAGTSQLMIRNGPCGDSWVTSRVTHVTGGGLTRVDPLTPPAHRLVVVGDSVANGWNATNPGLDGWAARLKNAKANGRVTLWGCGGYSLLAEASIAGWFPSFANTLAALLDGTVSNKLVWALCINDAMLGASWSGGATGFGNAVGTVIDVIHAAVPAAQIYLWGPHTCTNSSGSAEATVSPYRTALLSQATSRSGWCTAVNASAWAVAMDNTDSTHLHPSAAGHLTIGTNTAAAVGWT